MKWNTEWWGITLQAENETDKDLLEELHSSLDEEPAEPPYEKGVMVTERDEDGILKKIIFER